MKKIVILTLLALLLTGCANGKQPPTEPAVETTEPAPTGLYEADSAIEDRTGGALRSYRIPETDCYRLLGVGDRLLVLSGTENMKLSVFSGELCLPENTAVLPIPREESVWALTDTGFAYYDPQNRQVVYLDSQLQTYHTVALPENMEGTPVIAPGCDALYYCAGQEIRGLDTERGISRLIKSQDCESQQLTGCYFDGSVLSCQVQKGGQLSTVYLSAENGGTYRTDDGIRWLKSYADRYLGSRMDGVTPQYITGLKTETAAQLNVPAGTVEVMDATALDGAVGYHLDEMGAAVLSYYDLVTGQRTAAVSVGEALTPVDMWADRWSGCIWILCRREDTHMLLRWDVRSSQVTEETSYLGSVYTQSAPDEAGLAALQDRVSALNKQHGTAIKIWQEAVKTPGSYALKPEYQVPAISALLDQLEPVLGMFPADFLRKSVNSKLRICVVRSVDGERSSVRYWVDGDAYVVLPVGNDPKEAFLRAMGHIVDSHVLGNSPLLDDWAQLNPEGFVYGGEVAEAYLKGETRAFADKISAESMTDDRAMLFYYAMLSDNGAMFEAPIMQQKLLLLCQSIRDAWRWEKKTEVYPWEQYLTESIAYVK